MAINKLIPKRNSIIFYNNYKIKDNYIDIT